MCFKWQREGLKLPHAMSSLEQLRSFTMVSPEVEEIQCSQLLSNSNLFYSLDLGNGVFLCVGNAKFQVYRECITYKQTVNYF